MTNRFILLLAAVFPLVSCAQPTDTTINEINQVLDGFHDAAANGDKSRYLGLMSDNAVFMGTDESERWPKNPDFISYVDARFVDGRGWTYESVDRHVQVHESSNVAWFDEVVYSQTNGRFRGTGTLVRNNDTWQIAHYAMSFLIYNENWEEVIELTRRTAADKAASE